ncbi:MAG: hypothetical protein ACRYFX_09910 [Janthinobacterium lividum]
MATNNPTGCIPDLTSFLPDCAALSSVAGVRSYFYATSLKDVNIVFGADGSILSITRKTGGKFAKFEGTKFQNSGNFELSNSAIGKKRWKHAWHFRAFYRSQASRNTLQSMALIDDMVIIAPNNDNLIEVYGPTVGLSPSSGKGGTGIKLDDDNTALFDFEGEEPKLPPLFSTVAGPVATTTNTSATTASTTLTVASATGIVVGQVVSGPGITPGSLVMTVAGTTLTLSAPATVAANATLTFSTTDAQDFATNLAVLDTLVNA